MDYDRTEWPDRSEIIKTLWGNNWEILYSTPGASPNDFWTDLSELKKGRLESKQVGRYSAKSCRHEDAASIIDGDQRILSENKIVWSGNGFFLLKSTDL